MVSVVLLLFCTATARPDKPIAAPASVRTVEVVGTSFRVTFTDGRVVAGTDLLGATLSIALSGVKTPERIRLDRIVPAPDDAALLLYRITVLSDRAGEVAHDLCEPDAKGERWAFPLKGQWDTAGRRLSDRGLTLACAAGGAIGKCVRWGYKPWATTAGGIALAPYHAACVNMVRAAYCGSHGTTRDGMTIDYWDTAGVNMPEDAKASALGLRFEAAWSTRGAVCVAHTRVPQNMTLEKLGRSCPYLEPRLGAQNCIAERAVKGQYGPALLFDRSY
jgi:hypothetical protein